MGTMTWMGMTAALAVIVAAPVGPLAAQGSTSYGKPKTPAQSAAHTSTQHEGKQMKNIVTVAAENGNFKTLVAAVQAAGLVETLSGPGPFTVFAPTDAAFAKLPPGTVEALLADKAKLAAILTYHVVPGKLPASEVLRMGGGRVTSVNGQQLTVQVKNGKVLVDNATVVTADVMASNGVIHVIDTVVLPKETAAPAGAR